MRWLPDLQMGEMAAQELVEIWLRSQAGPEVSWSGIRHKFSRAKELGRQRALAGSASPTCDSAEAIFQVVRQLRTRTLMQMASGLCLEAPIEDNRLQGKIVEHSDAVSGRAALGGSGHREAVQ